MNPICIKKEVSLKKVLVKYKPIIKEVKFRLLNYSDKIHSIYLYGSVATGKAKSPTSDLDLVVVLNRKPTVKLKDQLKNLESKLSLKYTAVFREVGFAITYKGEVLQGNDSFGWKFFLTVLSIKIYGTGLFKKKVQFYPTKKLAKNLHSDIAKNLKEARSKIKSANPTEYKLQIKSIMKKIIRTAFSIVMEKDNFWTTDSDKMVKIFIKYYPEKKKEIKKVLNLTKNHSPNKNAAISIIGNFGKWVSREFFKQT